MKTCKHGIRYLKEVGIKVQPLSQDVIRDERRCSHCGACVPLCPAGTFVVEPLSRKVHFYADKCIACGLCVRACPFKAMEVRF